MTQAGTPLVPTFLDPFPGQFALRTFLAETFVTARGGGAQSYDALLTNAQSVGPNEKFVIEGYLSSATRFKTAGGYYVAALNGGGVGGGTNQDHYTLTTDAVNPGDTAWFVLHGPTPAGLFTITTYTGNYVTAVGGGGKSAEAFHTDATQASTWEEFYVTKIGDLGSGYSYAIKPIATSYPANTSHTPFLNAVNGGGLQTGNAVSATNSLGASAKFRLVQQANGTYAIQTSNGINYVTADQGGGLAHGSPSEGDLQTNRTVVQAWEQFKFNDQGNGIYTIQTASGFYLGIKNDFSTISTRISFPDAAPSIGYTAKFELIVTNPGVF